MQRFTNPEDVTEALEELWSALVGKFCKPSLFKSRRFHVYRYVPHAPFADQVFSHCLVAGGL